MNNDDGENLRKWFLAGRYLGKVEQFWNGLNEKVQFDINDIRKINQLLNNLELRSRRITIPGSEMIDIYNSDVNLVVDIIVEAQNKSKK